MILHSFKKPRITTAHLRFKLLCYQMIAAGVKNPANTTRTSSFPCIRVRPACRTGAVAAMIVIYMPFGATIDRLFAQIAGATLFCEFFQVVLV